MMEKSQGGISLLAQWLGRCASTSGHAGSIPGQGTKIPYATRPKKKKKNDGIPSKGLHTASLLLNVGEIICFSRGPQMVYLYDFTFLIHVSSPPEPPFLWILII